MNGARRKRRSGFRGVRLLAALVVGAAIVWGAGSGARSSAAGTNGGAGPSAAKGIAGWVAVRSYDESTLSAGEGVATVLGPHHRTHVLYRGFQSIPGRLKAEGWAHIGDPDSYRGDVIDAYQGPSSRNSKMFLVTTPSGKSFKYVHTLVRGEQYNNSFVAISPNAQWMVAGEWGTMNHLQVYRTPLLNHDTQRHGGPLRLAASIRLDHKVNDVQGCDFVTARRLVCASDDDSRSLFSNEKPLLEVDLRAPLHGHNTKGHVVDLGAIPQESTCAGTFEAEGVDFDASTGILRVEVIQPGSCILKTTVYEYKRAGGRG